MKKYKIEIITASICTMISGAILWSVFGAHLSHPTWETPGIASGDVLVRHVDTGAPLFGGNDTRDAVEKRIHAIRMALSQWDAGARPFVRYLGKWAPQAGMPQDLDQIYRSMHGADLRDADLHGLDFREISLNHCDFSRADLSGALLKVWQLEGSRFEDADLSDIDFKAPFFPALQRLIKTRIVGARFQRCDLEGLSFDTDLTNCDFRNANLRWVSMAVHGTRGLDVRGADLRKARIYCNLEGTGDLPDRSDACKSMIAFLSSLVYDDATRVTGLRMSHVKDESIPFVQWALKRGALLTVDKSPGENSAK